MNTPKRCHHLSSDDLIAPCAQEGGTFRNPVPVRATKPDRVWPGRLVYLGCALVLVATFGAALS